MGGGACGEPRGRGKAMGSYGSLFGEAQWRRPAILGMILCVSGVVGLWGVGFFSGALIGPAIEKALRAQNLSPAEITAGKQWWTAANLIVQNIGAFFGMIVFSKLAAIYGRRIIFAGGFLAAFAVTIFFYKNFQTKADIWMTGLMGFASLASSPALRFICPSCSHPAAQHRGELLLQRRAIHCGHGTDHAGQPAKNARRPSHRRAACDRRRRGQG